jgi:hypothetical protein
MKDIYLLIEHGMDQGKEVAEEKEWEVYLR